MKILIADDSPTIVEVVRFLLQSHGYEVITASDGIEAISKTYETNPDLVLLDIEMPKMTGYQVCRLLKSDKTTRSIPIIILTSRDQKSDRFWGLSTGADEFMTKDFESEKELFTKIQKVLQQSTSQKETMSTTEGEYPISFQQSRITPPITEISVLEHVNHILDRQLFQATLVNELSYLAISMHSFFTTINSVFNLLAKVCEFHVASIFIKDENAYNIFLYVIPPVSRQFLGTMKQRVIRVYKEHQPLESVENIEMTILRDDLREKPENIVPPGNQVVTFFALPLKVRNSVIGILALGSTKENTLNQDVIETLRVFTNEASIVLDNALLFKQLEQSNLDLEETISQLKNTQAQLVQSEKMASLGQLVAGVAHEINTPSGAINAATSNLMRFLSSVVENFRHVVQQNLSPEDRETLLSFLSQMVKSITQERKSTIAIRKDTKHLENLLDYQNFSNVRRLAKQIARFGLNEEDVQRLLQILQRYDSDQIIDFLENCSKIVNASKDIRISIDIITCIVNALKMYSRIDQAKVEEVDIHEGIETTLIILQSQTKYGITVDRRYGNIAKIPCYANELNQVWTNIIHNAIQAMNGEGTLTIETYMGPHENLEGEETPAESIIFDEAPEEKIGVSISDTGHGIPPKIQNKIFDPYFTTKDQGEGSGLGLGIAQQIVERHHGEIRFNSEPGKTCFEILLPIAGVREEYLSQ